MTWNNQQPPWGSRKGPPGPEEIIAALLSRIKAAFDGGGGAGPGGNGSPPSPDRKGSLGVAGLAIMLGVAAFLAYSSFYTIQPGERGVVLRLGQYSKTSQPGLNFKVPLVDEVYKVDVENVRKEEFGFRSRVPGQQTVYQKQGFDNESLMLTGDKNVIDVEWIVQYKIQDPVAFLFKVADVRQAVRDISEAAIRQSVGNMAFDYVLGNRELLAGAMGKELQKALNSYQAGVKILTVQLQDVNPPEAVKPAFNEVNEADQDMKRLVNEAEEAYNRVIPKARGQAKEMLEESHGYAVERTNISKGDTVRFLALLKEYRAAQDVTRRRLYLETMRQVLPSVSEIYVMDPSGQNPLPLLNLRGAQEGLKQGKPRKSPNEN